MVNTYLFDQQNTGRMPYAKGLKKNPELVWKRKLPSYPEFGPESNCIIDNNGNLYFGCHNGLFYCLNNNGEIRWSFFTGGKIYSSPTFLSDNEIVFGSGSGYLYCINKKGALQWTYQLAHNKEIKSKGLVKLSHNFVDYIFNSIRSTLINIEHSEGFFTRSYKEKMVYIWASPKVVSNGMVLISGVGKGLHAINGENGKLLWTYNLGYPIYHIAGPAVDDNDNIYIPSKTRYFHCVDSNGNNKWVYDTKSNYHAWAAPTIDEENGMIYFSRSFKEGKAIIYALDKSGNLVWSKNINSGVRGSATISRMNYILIADFRGNLNFISKTNGETIKTIKLTNAQRGLWTTPSIDKHNNIFVSTKETRYSGNIFCLNKDGEILWKYKTGKALSTPVLDFNSRLYFGNWNGEFICLQT